MHWIILVVCCLILIVSLFYYKYQCSFVKPLSKIPGPSSAEIIRFTYCPRTEKLNTYNKFFHNYGPVFRVWIGLKCFVHIGSAELAQKILSCSVNIEKSYVYGFAKHWLGESLPIANAEMWHKRRKLLTPAFHFNILNNDMSVMIKHFQVFTDLLEKEIDSEQFDILPYITVCSMNTIGETAMNINLSAEDGLSKSFVECVHQFVKLFLRRLANPIVHFDFMHALTKNHRKMKKIGEELHKISYQIINENLSKRKERRLSCPKETNAGDTEVDSDRKLCKSFLDILLDKYEMGDKTLTLENIREEANAFIFAVSIGKIQGYDTVTMTIAFTIYLVGHDPEVQDKIHAELDSVLSSEDTLLNANTLAEMNYLECVIKESLRVYSPVPLVARCLKQPVTLDEYILPAGTDIAIHMHSIHRSPKYYSNPDKFDPSNFFPENVKKIHPFAFIPFSAGPRNCIGQKFGKLETKVALAMFFKKYKVKSMMKKEDLKLFSDLIMQPAHGIMVKIERR